MGPNSRQESMIRPLINPMINKALHLLVACPVGATIPPESVPKKLQRQEENLLQESKVGRFLQLISCLYRSNPCKAPLFFGGLHSILPPPKNLHLHPKSQNIARTKRYIFTPEGHLRHFLPRNGYRMMVPFKGVRIFGGPKSGTQC